MYDESQNISPGQAFVNAAETGDQEQFNFLHENYQARITADEFGRALMLAAATGRFEMVSFIVRHYHQIISNEYKGEALLWAALNNHFKIVECLLETCLNSININFKMQAFHSSVQNGFIQTLGVLLADHEVKEVALADRVEIINEAKRSKVHSPHPDLFSPIIRNLKSLQEDPNIADDIISAIIFSQDSNEESKRLDNFLGKRMRRDFEIDCENEDSEPAHKVMRQMGRSNG